VSERTITLVTLAEARKLESRTDWSKVAAAEDDVEEEIDWSAAAFTLPVAKEMVSIRLDQDVLDFFRRGGKGYQTRMNAVLRSFMASQSKPR
jgi:uncharacterized protein (DUF4415 family)